LFKQRSCKKSVSLEKDITKIIRETADGFIIDWIYFQLIDKSGFYKATMKVNYNGTIQTIKQADRVVDCGPDIMF
jgi:hypothetical protein